jgi:hypothetical protein
MKAKQLVTVAVATMLLIGGAAALGAASPGAAANDNATDAHDENVPADAGTDDADDAEDGDAANASEAREDNAEGVGPSDGLPEQVPDHVSQIHETIESHLNGEVDNLGQALNDLLANDGAADEAADGEDGDESDAADDDADSDADNEETDDEDADADTDDESTETSGSDA